MIVYFGIFGDIYGGMMGIFGDIYGDIWDIYGDIFYDVSIVLWGCD